MQPTEYLVARIIALKALVASTEASFDAGDWEANHAPRLALYRETVGALRQTAADTALSRLRQAHELDEFDEDVLIMALAATVDHGLSRGLAALRRSFHSGPPTVDIAVSLLTGDLTAKLQALQRFVHGSLVSAGLVRLASPKRSEEVIEHEIRLSAEVRQTLLGMPTEEGVEGIAAELMETRFTFGEVLLSEPDQSALEDVMCRPWRRAPGTRLVLLVGQTGSGKTAVAHACAAAAGKPLLDVDTNRLAYAHKDPVTGLRDVFVEAKRAGAVVLFDNAELLFASRVQGNRQLQGLLRVLDESAADVIVTTQLEGMLDPSLRRRAVLRVELREPKPETRLTLWQRATDHLEPCADVDLPYVAEKFELTPAQIAQAGNLLSARTHGGKPFDAELLEVVAQAQAQHHLEEVAVKTATTLRLTDIVLPDDLMTSVKSIIAAVSNRRRILDDWGFGDRLTTGRGLNMLFRGESGTGKTLAAEIVAAELGMPLYRVAIPRIVSKYIGETEQNLEKAFREAEVAGAMLLFDEADAIFTKRVDVGSATDRYSNMEVNLLLQELERFEGTVVLTTNLDAAIDDAFERRLNYKLDFVFPTADLRRRIWARHLPDKAPIEVESEELDYLAEQFELSGGSIKNVTLRAAYVAAESGSVIRVEHLEAAAHQEYRELGKLVRS